MVRIIASMPSVRKQKGRPWRRVLEAIEADGIVYDLFTTRAPEDAITLARECTRTKCSMVVAAGGDGTVGEVVNGLMQVPMEERPPLGIIPLGRGNDLARALPIPMVGHEAVSLLTRGQPHPVDVGVMTCRAAGGGERCLHFLNLASIGFAADVAQAVTRYGRNLGGTWPYVRGLVENLLRWRNRPARVEVNGERHESEIFTVNVANGRYYGGGMFAAPRAAMDDGLFDVVVMQGLSLFEVIRYMPNNYNGDFDSVPKVRTLRGSSVSVETDPPLLVQLDGDVVGTTPARFELIPGAVRLLY